MDIKSIHESGHCIASISIGVEFVKVSLERKIKEAISNVGDTINLTSPNVSFINFKNISSKERKIIALAGSIAESVFIESKIGNLPINRSQFEFTISEKAKEFLKIKNSSDYKVYLENANSEAELDEDIKNTMEIIKNNWENIILLSDELEIKKIMTYAEVMALVRINN
ncbi:MAG: hypothetical protein IPM32_00800 [Ignavibacteriae bacterium]|nr:hypothetical protein [Ignavibacteriota bacterium]